MKLYLIISLIFHIATFILAGMTTDQKKTQQEQSKRGSEGKEQGQDSGSIQIIEINETQVGTIEKKELKRFYWGIGITSGYITVGDSYHVKVIDAYNGYTAEAAGLVYGDLIIAIDGKPMGPDNDIRGDVPRRMVLTVKRNGTIMRIPIERVQVYY